MVNTGDGTSTRPVTPDDVRGTLFTTVPARACRDRRLSPSDKAVLLALCGLADNETGVCWPSHARLAHETGLSEPTIRRSLSKLRATGYVTWTARFQSSNGAARRDRATNLYRVVYAAAAPIPDAVEDDFDEGAGSAVSTEDGGGGGKTDYPPTGICLPTVGNEVSHGTVTGDGTVPSPVIDRTRLSELGTTPPPHARATAVSESDTAVRAGLDPRAIAAYEGFTARERRPGATADLLLQVHAPIGGGRRYDWPVISAALVELSGSQGNLSGLSAPLLRGCCRRLEQGPDSTSSASPYPGSAINQARALWDLARAEGLFMQAPREVLRDVCTTLDSDPRLASVGCATGHELFTLVQQVRLSEFGGTAEREERFALRELASRIAKRTLVGSAA